MKPILLPPGNFGVLILFLLVLLIVIVPFTITLYVVSMAFPWWVAVPVGTLSGLLSFLFLVRFKGQE